MRGTLREGAVMKPKEAFEDIDVVGGFVSVFHSFEACGKW